MPGYTKDENSLATGIPDRNIGPETGSFGNATVTNSGDTSEGVNQDHQSAPPPAAGLDGPRITTDDLGERRSFAPGADSIDAGLPEDGVEPVYQQIADGGDRFDPDKRLNETDEERKRRDQLEREERRERP